MKYMFVILFVIRYNEAWIYGGEQHFWWANLNDSVHMSCTSEQYIHDHLFCSWTSPYDSVPMLYEDIKGNTYPGISSSGTDNDCSITLSKVTHREEGPWTCNVNYEEDTRFYYNNLFIRDLQVIELYPRSQDGELKLHSLTHKNKVYCRVIYSRPLVSFSWTINDQDVSISSTVNNVYLQNDYFEEVTYASESVLEYDFSSVADGSKLSCIISHQSSPVPLTETITIKHINQLPTTPEILNNDDKLLQLSNLYFPTTFACYASSAVHWKIGWTDIPASTLGISNGVHYSLISYQFENKDSGSEVKCIDESGQEDTVTVTVSILGNLQLNYESYTDHIIAKNVFYYIKCYMFPFYENIIYRWMVDGEYIEENNNNFEVFNNNGYSELMFIFKEEKVHNIMCVASIDDNSWSDAVSTQFITVEDPAQMELTASSYNTSGNKPVTLTCNYVGLSSSLYWDIGSKRVPAAYNITYNKADKKFTITSTFMHIFDRSTTVDCTAVYNGVHFTVSKYIHVENEATFTKCSSTLIILSILLLQTFIPE